MNAASGNSRLQAAYRAWQAIWGALRFAGAGLKYGSLETIEYRGERIQVMGQDAANGRTICRIVADRRRAQADGRPPARLVTFQREFRRVAGRERVGGLLLCLDHVDRETICLGIWLAGRTHSGAAIPEIARLADRQNVRIRREVARALRRLGAWAELRAMAEGDFDPQVIRLATSTPPRPLDERLRRATRTIHSAATTSGRFAPASFFAELPIGPGRAAKPASLIRAILERIRQAVRGC